MGAKIRREELELMQFEETRRYLVIQEKLSSFGANLAVNFQQDVNVGGNAGSERSPKKTVNMTSNTPFQGLNQYQTLSLSSQPSFPIDNSPRSRPQNPNQSKSNYMPFQSPEFFKQSSMRLALPAQQSQQQSSLLNNMSLTTSPIINTKNLEAIISWLAFPRNVYLKDRHSQREYTIVIDSDMIENKEMYVLKWFEVNNQNGGGNTGLMISPVIDEQSILKGYVYLQDILSIQMNPNNTASNNNINNILTLQLASHSRTLKSSGGRTVLLLQFSSESECFKYLQGMQSLNGSLKSSSR